MKKLLLRLAVCSINGLLLFANCEAFDPPDETPGGGAYYPLEQMTENSVLANRDKNFNRGFLVHGLDATSAYDTSNSDLVYSPTNQSTQLHPQWYLNQYGFSKSFKAAQVQADNQNVTYSDGEKSITTLGNGFYGAQTLGSDLKMKATSKLKYQSQLRQANDYQFPNFYLTQRYYIDYGQQNNRDLVTHYPVKYRLGDLAHLYVKMKLKVSDFVVESPNQTPQIHDAQFNYFATVGNMNSPGRYLWAGFNIFSYNAKGGDTGIYKTVDKVDDGYYIYSTSGTRVGINSSQFFNADGTVKTSSENVDSDWVEVNVDLMSWLAKGTDCMTTAYGNSGTDDWDQLYLTEGYFGWELPGKFTAEMVIKDYQLIPVFKNSNELKTQMEAAGLTYQSASKTRACSHNAKKYK